ncbi:ABC transporter substrate-binding protein [Thalassospira profundimaris]|uniref:ABC transporter substrate-binding protein n=1 Tax=Thalassospira profundimaris TaxID=502049 RepID=A0A367XF86_9PROT|nr:ABC transporter substrate-binding protein [Thalassospira profundimaris]RCK52318.1 ABC transporter substrate-binding protein [Thalassospira profundimaris]
MTSVLKRLVAAGVFAAGLSSVAASAQATDYPLEIQNCGRTVTFDHAPKRVVSLGQSNTEILYLLGLSSKVVGTAVWFDPVMPQFAEANRKIPRLADNDPSFESVVGQRPDLVTAQFQWHVGPSGIVGTTAQFDELGIPVYVAPADCVGKDNSTGGDGTRTDAFSMDLIYKSIHDLSCIFDVEDRGEKLIAGLKQREQAAKQDVAGLAHRDVSAVFWFSSSELHADPYVAGQKGAPGYISGVLGLNNVIKSNDEWPTVGWETIARADPDIIVIAKMDRRRYPADDWQLKMNFLKTDPVTSQMKAVKNGHIVVMDVMGMDPTIRTIDGIEQLAAAVKSFGLDK